jgi:hypothetical protein
LVGVESVPLEDHVRLPEHSTLLKEFILVQAFHTALEEEEHLVRRAALSSKDSPRLDAHGVKAMQVVSIEPHVSILEDINGLNRIFIKEAAELSLQMWRQNIKELIDAIFLTQRNEILILRVEILNPLRKHIREGMLLC